MQRLSDALGVPVDRPAVSESTAMGAAYLAGLQANVYPAPDQFSRSWRLGASFRPQWDEATRTAKMAGWRDAVARTLTRR
jgi:glycerol kinase